MGASEDLVISRSGGNIANLGGHAIFYGGEGIFLGTPHGNGRRIDMGDFTIFRVTIIGLFAEVF